MKSDSCKILLMTLFFLAYGMIPQAFAQKAMADYSPLFKTLSKGKAVEVNDANSYYLYGVVSKYESLCGWPDPDTLMDFHRFIDARKVMYAKHVLQRGPLEMFAAPISNANDVQQGADAVSAYVEKKSCKPSKLSEGLEKLVLGKRKKGEVPVFISSCMTRGMSREQCRCLGEAGESIVTGTLDTPYRDGMVTSWAQRNPFLAFSLPSQCNL